MANYDHDLGMRVHAYLNSLGLETPASFEGANSLRLNPRREPSIEGAIGDILTDLNLDMSNDSLRETPHRVAKMYCQEIFYGLDYGNFPKCTTVNNGMIYTEMVCSTASVVSLCEHHLVPFQGSARVAYIPNKKVLGLSKINRIVDFFSRRPQIQERLTMQICEALRFILETENVAVIIRAEHLCVKLRGVKDQLSQTTTSKMGGKFMSNPTLRAEFLSIS